MFRLLFVLVLSVLSSAALADSSSSFLSLKSERSPAVTLMGKGRNYSDMSEYDIRVDGKTYTVTIGSRGSTGQVSLYGSDGVLVVGYRYANGQMLILDGGGVVDFGGIEDIELTPIRTYGAAARLLTNPNFLADLLVKQGVASARLTREGLPWSAVFDSPIAMLFSA